MTNALKTTETSAALDSFTAELDRAASDPRWNESTQLAELRRLAASHFRNTGLPHQSDEEWRFTSLSSLARTRFVPADHSTSITPHDLAQFTELSETRFVFVNGYYSDALSTTSTLPKGVIAGSLKSLLETHKDLILSRLGKIVSYERTPFAALNTALMEDGLFVSVPKGVIVEQPIHVIFTAAAPGEPVIICPRVLLIAEASSQVTLVETYSGTSGQVYFSNGVTEFALEENAVVDHYRLQEDSTSAFHASALDASIVRASNFSTQSFTFGGALVRNDIGIELGGEGGFATMNGLTMIAGRQVVDNHTRLDHAMPNCETHEFFKSILDDQARGVFNGKIMVRQIAQKTNSKQTNKNLLLSKEALINTNPQLEIFADDVKCTHGATIGQLEENALYYLQSRGIPKEKATRLLTFAFANDLIQRVKIASLRDHLEQRVVHAQHDAEQRHAQPV